MHSLNFFIHFVEAHRFLGYGLLYVSMFFEGELFLTAAGMLSRLRAFHLFDAFVFSFAGVLSSDIAWYFSGRYLRNHHSQNRYLNFAIRRVKKLLPNVEKNPWHVIFISKFIYGLNHSTILVLGYLGVEFKHFFRVQFFTSLLWSVIFLTVGWAFGNAAISFTHRLDKFLMIALLFLIFILFFEKILGLFIAKKEQK